MDTASFGRARSTLNTVTTNLHTTLIDTFELEPGTLPSLEVWRALLAHLASREATSHLPFESILNSVPIQIVVFDAQHRYLFCNPESIKNETIRTWIIGKDDFEYCAHRGFDVSIAQGRRERFLRAVESRTSAGWEETFTDPQGDIKHHWRNLMPIFDDTGRVAVRARLRARHHRAQAGTRRFEAL